MNEKKADLKISVTNQIHVSEAGQINLIREYLKISWPYLLAWVALNLIAWLSGFFTMKWVGAIANLIVGVAINFLGFKAVMRTREIHSGKF